MVKKVKKEIAFFFAEKFYKDSINNIIYILYYL